MKRLKILVPTDFSAYARNALDFAVGLSEFYNLEIILFHSLIYHKENLPLSDTDEMNILQGQSIEKLCNESDFIKSKNHNIYVKIILDKQEVEPGIANVIDKEKVDYIVMGTQGESGLQTPVFGSFTSNVLIIADCPVFTIPLTGHYKKINKILCLTEMDESEMNAIKQSLILARRYESEIIFYNVASNVYKQAQKLAEFKKQIMEITSYPLIDYITEQSGHPLDSIESYTCETHPDLIITLGKEKNLWDKLFSKRITKKLCLHTSVPLLSFPETFHT